MFGHSTSFPSVLLSAVSSLLGLLLSISPRAETFYPEPPIQQLIHRSYTFGEGAPSNISALAQTSDGTLWIGGGSGLTRFDGVRFVRYPVAPQERLRSTNISALTASPSGGLWIGFRLGGVSFLKNGRLTNYGGEDRLPPGNVTQFAWDRDDSLWVAARGGLAHFDGKRWEAVALGAEADCFGVLVDRLGTLWVATSDRLLARAAGETQFRQVIRLSFDVSAGVPLLAQSPDGKVWAMGTHELIRVDQPDALQGTVTVVIRGFNGFNIAPIVFDREGNLWGSHRGLLRIPARELARSGAGEMRVEPDIFSNSEGPPGTQVSAILEDREQNIWLGGGTGLHRLTHSKVTTIWPAPCQVAPGGPIAAGEDGGIWAGCFATEGGIYELRDGRVVNKHSAPRFSVAHRDSQGTVWFGGPSSLGRIEGGRLSLIPLPQEMAGSDVQALVRDGNGGVWVSLVRKGIFRYFDGQWSRYGGVNALPQESAIVETADNDGDLWFGYSGGRIARLHAGDVQLFDSSNGLEIGNVLSILAAGRELWSGGEFGLAHLYRGRFMPVHTASATAFRGISGIVQSRSGDLWVNGINGITRIGHSELDHVLVDPSYPVQSDTFNYLDGVPGTAVQLRPLPSAFETTDGHVWFSTSGGIATIDATHLTRNTLPPPVTIWSLSAGGKRLATAGRPPNLPIGSTDVEIDYSAGSLTVPERVRFRYKLEGSDRDWHDVGTRREALYTNLGPGNYLFRVIACNNDGVWNLSGSTIEFTIPYAFYQTQWFYALCGLLGTVLLSAFYRVRVRQVATQVRGRLEARLAERERIARDLHDTLLQGVQGLIWRFQAATDRIPSDQPARQLMQQSIDRADKLLEESRDRVKDLRRTVAGVSSLAEALAVDGEQLGDNQSVKFSLRDQGGRRELHQIVLEEAVLIGREAISNAFRHSGAKNIEAEVTYGIAELHVQIRDDGCGISTHLLGASEKTGHFGLIGMRERATKLGGRLEIWSKPGAGTEIDLRVPARVAYRETRSRPFRRSLLEFFRRRA